MEVVCQWKVCLAVKVWQWSFGGGGSRGEGIEVWQLVCGRQWSRGLAVETCDSLCVCVCVEPKWCGRVMAGGAWCCIGGVAD